MAKETPEHVDDRHPLPEDRPDFPGNDELPPNDDNGGGNGGGTTPPVEKTWWQKHWMTVVGIGGIVLIVGLVLLFALT